MTETFTTSVSAGDTEGLLGIAGSVINRKLIEVTGLRMAGKPAKTLGIAILRISLTVDEDENTAVPLLLKLEYVDPYEQKG